MPNSLSHRQLGRALWNELHHRVSHHGRPLIAVHIELASAYSVKTFTKVFKERLKQEGWSSVRVRVSSCAHDSRIKTLEYSR